MARSRVEDTVLGQIRQAAEEIGFLTFHVFDSRRCPPGFPDLWILGFGKLIVLELKAGRNTTTKEQDRWLTELRTAGIDARVYHVTEWRSRAIIRELNDARNHWRRHGATKTRPATDLDAIRLRLGRYNLDQTPARTSALAADVPALLAHIDWLTTILESTKRLAAGVTT